MTPFTKHSALFTGHQAGAYTLPPALLQARDAVDRLAVPLPEPTDPTEMHAELVEQTVRAAALGQPLPDVGPLLQARHDHAAARAAEDVRYGAWQTATARLGTALQDHADEVLTGHLQPALDAVYDDAQTAAARFPVDTTDRQLLLADAPNRKAWAALEDTAHRYSLVRAAQADVLRASAEQPTDDNEWEFFDNLNEVWPGYRTRSNFGGDPTPPWPADPRQFLLWLAHHQLRPTALPVAERNARWQQQFGAAKAERVLRHEHARALAGH